MIFKNFCNCACWYDLFRNYSAIAHIESNTYSYESLSAIENIFDRFITTMIEISIRHYTPETKQLSRHWTVSVEAKTVSLTRKVMASEFRDIKGNIFIVYLKKGKTINFT